MSSRWTLITGGAKRLGARIALALARSKRDIVVQYRTSEKEAHALVNELRTFSVRAEAIYGDFSTPSSTEQFVKDYIGRFAQTDALISNVGNYLLGSPLKTEPHEWPALFQTNLFAPLALMQALAPELKKTKGQIINIGMVGCGEMSANTHATAYNTSKTALFMATKSLAKELAPFHVRVNMVSPGYLEESIDSVDPKSLPMGRLATYEEVVRAITFLMDPASSYITGQNLEIAGGVRL